MVLRTSISLTPNCLGGILSYPNFIYFFIIICLTLNKIYFIILSMKNKKLLNFFFISFSFWFNFYFSIYFLGMRWVINHNEIPKTIEHFKIEKNGYFLWKLIQNNILDKKEINFFLNFIIILILNKNIFKMKFQDIKLNSHYLF